MPHYKAPDNSLHFLDSEEHEHFLPQGSVQIADEEAASMQPKFIASTYKELRAASYPSFADQFDLLYHGGVDAWKAAIQAVKDKYPKV